MKRFLLTTLLSAMSLLAYGAKEEGAPAHAKPSAVAQFKESTQQQMAACAAAPRKNSAAKIAAPEPGKDCILAGHAKIRSIFPDALKEVSNNPAASELLKDFYSAWLAAFDNQNRGARESIPKFQQRTAEERAKYEALWERFEKEAGKKQ